MGMVDVAGKLLKAVPKESALLKCEKCGNARRVWLNECQHCRSPEANWYEERLAQLEDLIERQNKLIQAQVNKLHTQSAELRGLREELGLNGKRNRNPFTQED